MGQGVASGIDMYRKVPTDLLEGTKRGSALSVMAVLCMLTLFGLESYNHFANYSTLVSDLALDKDSSNPKIRVNFNITMMDLRCDWAVIDVVSTGSGATEQNITQHVTKFQLDQDGVRKRYHQANPRQHDMIMFDETVTETLEELTEDGVDAIDLDEATFEQKIKDYKFVFVDFFASWCSHCRDLAPTWEALAEVMDAAASQIVDKDMEDKGIEFGTEDHHWTETDYEHAIKLKLPVVIAKVDCVTNEFFCRRQGIMAYPTLRLFVDGSKYGNDYNGHRTIVDFTDYLATIEKSYLQKHGHVDFADEIANRHYEKREGTHLDDRKSAPNRVMQKEWFDDEHPGCQMSGFLMLDRVPGNFRIQARSRSHDLVPSMTNVSHEVHSLSFGEPYIRRRLERGLVKTVPPDLVDRMNPMDGNVYVTKYLHEAHHHYIKVVPTYYTETYSRQQQVHQLLISSQLAHMDTDDVPEATFQYDLSPIAVTYRTKTKHWYHYVTSCMAIVGGTFTVVGMLESSFRAVTRKRRF